MTQFFQGQARSCLIPQELFKKDADSDANDHPEACTWKTAQIRQNLFTGVASECQLWAFYGFLMFLCHSFWFWVHVVTHGLSI